MASPPSGSAASSIASARPEPARKPSPSSAPDPIAPPMWRSAPVFPLSEAGRLPRWRRPVALLLVMAFAMPIAFATWSALLNNFVIEVANFDGADIGWLHSVREIPGFLAVGVIALIMVIREQVLGLVSLVV